MSHKLQPQDQLPTREELHRLIGDINRYTRALELLDDAQITVSHTLDSQTHPETSIKASQLLAADRYELQTACESLAHAAKGFKDYLCTFAQSHRPVSALQYTVHFHLAKHVPQEGVVSFKELATKAGIPEPQCQRAIRTLVVCEIFEEPAVGYVTHNRYARLLADDEGEAALGVLTDECFRAASCLAPAAIHWNHSQERTKAPFNLAFNTEISMFDFQSSQELWRAERFRKTMAFFGGSGKSSLEHLIHGFDWTSLTVGQLSWTLEAAGATA